MDARLIAEQREEAYKQKMLEAQFRIAKALASDGRAAEEFIKSFDPQ